MKRRAPRAFLVAAALILPFAAVEDGGLEGAPKLDVDGWGLGGPGFPFTSM